MKFGEYLEEHLVSEWRSQYLDYSKGKSKVKKLKAFLRTSNGCQHQLNDSYTFRRDDVFDDLENCYDFNCDARSVVNLKKSNWMDYQPKYTLDSGNQSNNFNSNCSHLSDEELDEELEDDDDDEDDEDDEDDFKVVSLIGNINGSLSPPTNTSFNINKKDETIPLLQKKHRSHSTSILYIRGQETQFTCCDDDIVNLARHQFLDWVDLELEKVNAFFKFKEHDCCKRFIIILDQLEKLEDYSSKWNDNISEATSHDLIIQTFSSKIKKSAMLMFERANFIFDYFEMPKMPNFYWKNKTEEVKQIFEFKTNPPPPFIARLMIKKAICELYHKIELLESYRSLNQLAFRKLIKKYDKNCQDSKLNSYILKVANSYFCSSQSLNKIQHHLEDKFTELFENGHRKIAVTKLKTVETKSYYIQDFISGYLIGISVPLISLFIYYNKGNYDDAYIIHFWSSVFLLVLAGFLFAINCAVWDLYKINYKLVFELNAHDALDYREYLVLPSFVCFIASIFAFFGNSTNDPNILANVFFYLSLFVFLCPLNILYLKARLWLIVSIFRLFLSGFYPVEFRDFFFGVMTCSLTYPIANIPQFFHPSLSSLVYMTCIPPLWRSMQCLRRFLDTGDWFPHFANLAKYLITTTYFFMVPTYRSNKSLKALFITIASINSMYSIFWDVCMDWSLFQHSDNMFLRDVLIYKKKWIYYTAIITDTILRFQWLIYMIQIEQKTIFFVAIIELFRRFMWMFFRMENEHASNMNLLRVSRVCELPYPYNIRQIVSNPTIQEFDIDVDIRRLFDVNDSIHDQESIISMETVYSTTTAATGWQQLSRVMSRAHAKEFQQREPIQTIEE